METDKIYMERALELAGLALGFVSPNPLVGCVIVHNHKIIGEGYHRQYGGPHAEVNAVNSVVDKALLAHSTVYVTLEPCSHFGKTPPCADLLIKHKVEKVVVAVQDPNPKVSGRGIQKLRDAGINVEVGLLREEAETLNKRFFKAFEKKRPYIILKWAQTLDGFIARENYDSKWISDDYSRLLVHQWRAQEDAIMVGKNTAHYDDPTLTVREIKGTNPIRVVLDRKLELSAALKVFSDGGSTLCYNSVKSEQGSGGVEYVKIKEESMLEEILADLGTRNIQSVFVEGGAALLSSFIDNGLWDEARVFTSPNKFKSGIKAPILNNLVKDECLMADRLLLFLNS